ncbi:MAG: long-chain fatty acid--CoA ligase [Betaproteobacteria bacterium]|nr:long-chain fatty acid--CoA ligase [Betaproteobacteria bacterium]
MKSPLEVIRLYAPHDYSLTGAFASRWQHDPQRPFIVFEERTWSWQAFNELTLGVARVLAARGIRHGDRVAVMARNHPGHVLMLLGLARLGAIMVPVNPEFGVTEARYVMEHAQVAAVVCSAEALAIVREAATEIRPAPWFALLDGAVDGLPALMDLIAKTPADDVPAAGGADDTCLIVYTSGTTGFPKGAMHSQRSFVTGGEAFVQRLYVQPDDRLMIVLPLFHINALFYSVAGTLAAGACMVIVPRFSASSFWETAAKTRATAVNIIEAIGTILVKRPREEFRHDHLLTKLYGARQGMMETFRNEFHIPHLIGGYGMTEIPGVTCIPLEGPAKVGSMGPVGRHPDAQRPWAQCRVVDDDGNDVGVDQPGELIVKTPIIMQGYYRDAEQTNDAFRDGWFLTGDLVKRDADGYFFFVSRKKDIIRRRGENISGAELDRVIGEHPAVFEVAAIAVPSELGEDEILVAVVPRPGQHVTPDDIAEWSRQHLAAQKVPRFVAIVDELPHTPTHKILKAKLRADAGLRARAVDLQAVKV